MVHDKKNKEKNFWYFTNLFHNEFLHNQVYKYSCIHLEGHGILPRSCRENWRTRLCLNKNKKLKISSNISMQILHSGLPELVTKDIKINWKRLNISKDFLCPYETFFFSFFGYS